MPCNQAITWFMLFLTNLHSDSKTDNYLNPAYLYIILYKGEKMMIDTNCRKCNASSLTLFSVNDSQWLCYKDFAAKFMNN